MRREASPSSLSNHAANLLRSGFLARAHEHNVGESNVHVSVHVSRQITLSQLFYQRHAAEPQDLAVLSYVLTFAEVLTVGCESLTMKMPNLACNPNSKCVTRHVGQLPNCLAEAYADASDSSRCFLWHLWRPARHYFGTLKVHRLCQELHGRRLLESCYM